MCDVCTDRDRAGRKSPIKWDRPASEGVAPTFYLSYGEWSKHPLIRVKDNHFLYYSDTIFRLLLSLNKLSILQWQDAREMLETSRPKQAHVYHKMSHYTKYFWIGHGKNKDSLHE